MPVIYKNLFCICAILFTTLTLNISCSSNPSVVDGGSGIGTGNPVVTGTVYCANENAVQNAHVIIRKKDFLKDTSLSNMRITFFDTYTDDLGNFKIDFPDIGSFFIEVTKEVTKNSHFSTLFPCNISKKDTLIELVDTLRPNEIISGYVKSYGAPAVKKYVQIYGLDRVTSTNNSGNFSLHVPKGIYNVKFSYETDSYSPTTTYDIKSNNGQLMHLVLATKAISNSFICDSLIIREFLDSNGLPEITVNSIIEKGNGRIEEIEFSGSGYTLFTSNIGGLSTLKEAEIQNTLISLLPDRFGELINMKELDLSNNKLITLPKSIANLTKIEELNLAGNKLTVLPPEANAWANKYDPDWNSSQNN